MTSWIVEERTRLLKELKKVTWLSAAISFPATIVGGVIAYLIGIQRDLLPGAEQTLAIMIVAIALPVAVLILIGLRKAFWLRTIRAESEQLQSQQFLTQYVEAIGPKGLESLSVVAKAQVDQGVERERNGEAPSSREYAEALRYVLLVEPS